MWLSNVKAFIPRGSLLQLLLAPNEADDDNMQRGKQYVWPCSF